MMQKRAKNFRFQTLSRGNAGFVVQMYTTGHVLICLIPLNELFLYIFLYVYNLNLVNGSKDCHKIKMQGFRRPIIDLDIFYS